MQVQDKIINDPTEDFPPVITRGWSQVTEWVLRKSRTKYI